MTMAIIKCKIRNSKEYKNILIDDEDYPSVCNFKWREDMNGYAIRSAVIDGKRSSYNVYLHKMIMNPNEGLVVDHINGDVCDNRKSNLRVCTRRENSRNRKNQSNNKTGFKGVVLDKRSNKYHARISINGRQTYIGTFENPAEAYYAYCRKALEHFGEFARI